MIDLHSHLLPEVDDGSRCIPQSLRTLSAMAEMGVRGVCLTPHLSMAELTHDRLAERLELHADILEALRAAAGDGVVLYYGAEVMLDRELRDATYLDRRVCLGASRYVLVEFPRHLMAIAMRGLLRQVRERGLVPVIAHPERYQAIGLGDIASFRDEGALVQVDATSFATSSGTVGSRARAIVRHGLADIVAADNHGDQRNVAAASRRLADVGALLQADLLTETNPRAILADDAVRPVPPVELPRVRIPTAWVERLRALFAGYPPRPTTVAGTGERAD